MNKKEVFFKGRIRHNNEVMISDSIWRGKFGNIRLRVYGNWLEIYPETLSRYTGRTDCNDIGVFENDIVKVKDKYSGTVKADEESLFYVDDLKNGHCNWLYKLESQDIEVIGNIYDNKELPEGE